MSGPKNTGSTPKVGMPTAFVNSPSVAPACSTGSTGTPGQNSAVSFSIGDMTAGVNGGGEAVGPRVSAEEILTAGSAANSSSFARTASAVTPGKMRQLTLARARCGSALVACPASSMVATQVVRNVAFQLGSLADTTARACVLSGFFKNAFIAFAVSVSPLAARILAMPAKYARLPSVNCAGNS